MKTYKVLTLGDLIATLRGLANCTVKGLDGNIESYRGYYDRPATNPCHELWKASELAESYSSYLGEQMTGYKGGEFDIDPDKTIHYASYGECGPFIIGIEWADDGYYHPVLLEEFYG